jgi:hypothetical protein
MRRAAIALLTLGLAAPASAAAQTPAAGTMRLLVEKTGGNVEPLALKGSKLRIRGIVEPYVPGQQVTVRFHRGASKVRVVRVAVQRPKGAKAGQFVVGYTPTRTGRLRVRASHLATPELATIVAHERTIRVVSPTATAGAKGPSVRLLQRLLDARGYVVGQRGLYDDRTARAVLAFRKVSGMARTTAASADVFRRLVAGGGAFKVRYPSHGRHVEGDLSHQVIALIDHGKVERIYPTSSGAPVTPTVLGNFRVYRKDFGTNAKGMVHSSYFIRGYAIHGYHDVPVFPASHGCFRVPIPDAASIFAWVKLGDRVDVYYRTPGHKKTPPRADAGP